MDDLTTRFHVACAVAHEAADIARRQFHSRDTRQFVLKGPQDYFTEAGGEIERLIIRRIGEVFPDDAFFGEEDSGTIGERTWVIDPIDGTANFSRGNPYFGISIALVHDGQPVVGVVCNPMARELFAASRGGGATVNGRPLAVSEVAEMNRATIELGWSLRRPIADYVAMVDRVTATGAGFTRGGSGALGLAYVAAGRIDGYGELHINSWDCLAGIVLVREAGGWVNDFMAGDGLTQGNPLLACTPALRGPLIEATGIGTY